MKTNKLYEIKYLSASLVLGRIHLTYSELCSQADSVSEAGSKKIQEINGDYN